MGAASLRRSRLARPAWTWARRSSRRKERRCIATKEAPVHDHVKQAMLAASELDTRLIMRALRNTERVLKNAAVERVLAIERDKGAAVRFEDIRQEVAGVYPRI